MASATAAASNFLGVKPTVSCGKARGIFAASEGRAQPMIEVLGNQCIARCFSPPPPPPELPTPGALSGVLIFDYFGPPYDQEVTFSGKLVQGLGGTGETSFMESPRTEPIAPGFARSIGFEEDGLTAGTWQVTAEVVIRAANPRVTSPFTCDNVRVPGFIRFIFFGGSGITGNLRCEQTTP